MDYINEIDRPHPHDHCKDGCEKEVNLFASVKVPVDVEPKVRLDEAEVKCCGEPVIKCEHGHDGEIKFVIEQNIFVRIPVCFDVKVKECEPKIDCNKECK